MTNSKPLPEKKFDYDRAIEIILKVEKSLQIDKYQFDGILLWPLIRQQLWSNIQSNNNSFEYEFKYNNNNRSFKKYKIIPDLKKNILKLFCVRNYKKAYYKYKSYKQCVGECNRVLSIIDVDSDGKVVLMHSKSVYYQMRSMGGRVNVHLDPMYDIYMKENIPTFKINFKASDSVEDSLINSIVINVEIFREYYSRYMSIGASDSLKDKSDELKNILYDFKNSYELILKDKNSGFIDYEKIINELLFFKWYFDFIFKRINEHVLSIFTNCYYTLETMILIHVAKSYRITTVDVQHGKQGYPHGMYSNWENMPKEGYSTLPDIFLNWGLESANMINDSMPSNINSKHRAIVVGYPRVGYYKTGEYKIFLQNAEYEFLCQLDQYECVILFTLQPQNDVPQIVLDAISQLSSNYIFLVRMHPNMRQAEREEIRYCIKSSGINSYDISYSTSIDLFSLLEKTNIHITKWSSVCYEAAIFGVPTIIIGDVGRKMYRNQIRSAQFMYANNINELLHSIDNPTVGINNYILDDIDVTKRELLKLYKNAH